MKFYAFHFMPYPYLEEGFKDKYQSDWVTYPKMYSATCESADGATWLQVTHNAPPGDVRPLPAEPLRPTFGYHLDDLNLPMGNLVQDVRNAEASYGR